MSARWRWYYWPLMPLGALVTLVYGILLLVCAPFSRSPKFPEDYPAGKDCRYRGR